MEPKDMTNIDLIDHYLCCFDIVWISDDNESYYDELLRRLNETDALRKENEELKEEIYFFARTFRYYAGEAFRFYEKHPLARETDETRAANTTKEAEASHA